MKQTYRLKVEWSRLDHDGIDGDYLLGNFKTFYFTTNTIHQENSKIFKIEELPENYQMVIEKVVGCEWLADKIKDIGPQYGDIDSLEFTIEPVEIIEV